MPDEALRWTFQVACGTLAAVLFTPLYHWLIRQDMNDAPLLGQPDPARIHTAHPLR
ncbi:hypothetical protein [Streptomyces hawaiiensis]|uniref:hypothetical protein n=1 Tax=Streptomyces hawaiiensis TaxID=67305 RepID=UPI003649CEE3